MSGERHPGGYLERFYRCGDGLRLYYRDYGDAMWPSTPVVCLGGLTRNSKDFHPLARRLAGVGRRVLAPDYRGRGRSAYDPDWRRYHPRTYVEDVRHLLVANNLHRVVIIGTSLGGIVATAMAVAMPTVLAGVVLNDIGPEINPAAIVPIVEYLKAMPPLHDWAEAAERLRRFFPDLPAHDEESWIKLAKITYREDKDGLLRPDFDPAIVKPLLKGSADAGELWSLFRAIRAIPALAVRGELSTLLTEETLRRMAAALPLLATCTVPGVGHAPALTEPQAVVAIDAFLARF